VTRVGMDRAPTGSILRIGAYAASSGTGSPTVTFYTKHSDGQWYDSTSKTLTPPTNPGDEPTNGADVLTVNVTAIDRDGHLKSWERIGLDSTHPRYIGIVLAETPTRRTEQLENLFGLHFDPTATVASSDLRGAFVGSTEPVPDANHIVQPVTKTFNLTSGDDGSQPGLQAYSDALAVLESLEDISIVAAPGYSVSTDYDAITQQLIGHAEKRRSYRIAVLDTPPDKAPSEVRASKSKIDSTYAALYYPWVVVGNPLAKPERDDIPKELALPPSGFVTGIYARTDVQRGVYKAPANETVTGAIRFQSEINFATQEVLNPLGINCLRSLPNRGNRVWGARTISSDPEWKYVNVRRYFNYIERSIDIGTQWAVFEPNGERLWANIRDTIGAFLYNEWKNGALLGESFKEAAFVRCDRTTMDQNDLDNGRLVCLIGVAVLKPAEFVIFRIGQKTADARS
jgi:hypothetical protein